MRAWLSMEQVLPLEGVLGYGVKLPCFYRQLSVLLGQTTRVVRLIGKSVEPLSANR